MAAEIATLPVVLLLASTALLGTALAITRYSRRRSAEERHLLLSVTLLALLVLPAAVLCVPKVRLALSLPGFEPGLGTAATVVSAPSAAPGARAVRAPEAPASASRAAPGAAGAPSAAPPEHSAVRSPAGDRSKVAGLAVAGYFGVAALLLLGFAVGFARVGRRVRGLPGVADAETLQLAAELACRLGLRRRLRLRTCDAERTPWAWGVLRPTIVLPASFGAWSAVDKRNALVHEISHICRLDPVSMTLARVCAALYWLQPLAWFAVRRLRREAECACDDRVVLSGADESAYAEQLLGIAKAVYSDAQGPGFAPAMACTSQVSERIHSILDPRTRRTTVTRLKTTFSVVALLLIVTPFATLRSQDPNVPGSEAELERIVASLVAEGDPAAAVAMLVGWISGDYAAATGHCRICEAGLRMREDEQGGLRKLVLDAFDAVEARASRAGDAGLFMRLAEIVADAGTSDTLELGMHYVVQGQLLGSDRGEDRLVVMRYLLEMGEHEAAREVVEAVHNDSASPLYQSATTERWLSDIELRRERNQRIATTLGGAAGGTGTIEYVPLRKAAPAYPERAVEERREGYVIVEYTLMSSGRARDARVVESSDALFEGSALASVNEYRYVPRLDGGTPVDVPGVRTMIRFQLAQ